MGSVPQPAPGAPGLRELAGKTWRSFRERGLAETLRKVMLKLPGVLWEKGRVLCSLAGKTLRSLRENGPAETLRKIRRKLSSL